MMRFKKQIIFLFVFSSIISNSIAQSEVLNIPVGYTSTFYESKESLAISNHITGELVIFVEDTDISKAFLIGNDMQVKSAMFLNSLPNTFKEFIGHQINEDGSYSIFYTNNSKKKFGELNLDFINNNSLATEIDFKFKKEAYVESISHKGKFYLISATRSSNDVNFYTFKNHKFLDKKTVSFQFIEDVKYNYTTKAYHQLVSKGFSSGSLVKMDNKTPNAIETTSKPNKLYTIDDTFVFTFDNNYHFTKVIYLFPEDFKIKTQKIAQPVIDGVSGEFVNHNSYVYDDMIFQTKSTPSCMKFTVKHFDSQELLKEIVLNKEDSITFKNTPIMQEGPAFIAGTRTREMEATSKFLRKVSAGDIGIAVYKNDNDYRVTLGSKKEIRRGGAMMPMGGFGAIPMGGFGPISASFNPTFFAYGGYSSTKTVRIDCLFDGTFNHVLGDIPDNIFDKIKDFEDSFKDKLKSDNTIERGHDDIYSNTKKSKPELKNLFWHLGRLYFGYLDTGDRNYHLVEFIN